jgi:hypothetical protein
LTFRLRRATTIGAQALRGGRVVSSTGLEHLKGRTGRLVLALKRAEWPTSIRFITDLPKATLASPGRTLAGSVTLRASASAIRGRHVVSVLFQYSPAGKSTWIDIATVTAAPWRTLFDSTTVPNGRYDLRAVVTDSAKKVGASAVLRKLRIANPPGGATGSTGATGATT